MDEQVPSIYDWVGGRPVFRAWFELFYDLVESDELLQVHVALPGVTPDTITIMIEPGGVVVSALRPFPCRETGAHIHRIEIPYGRFERRIALPLRDPYMPIELVDKALVDGLLTLTFRRKEGA